MAGNLTLASNLTLESAPGAEASEVANPSPAAAPLAPVETSQVATSPTAAQAPSVDTEQGLPQGSHMPNVGTGAGLRLALLLVGAARTLLGSLRPN